MALVYPGGRWSAQKRDEVESGGEPVAGRKYGCR